MAVIKHLQVSVHADGEPLVERQDITIEEENESHHTTYIPATSGQKFAVHMATPAEYRFDGDLLSYDIYVDGKLVDNPLMEKGFPLPEEVSEGLLMPNGTMRRFQFSDLAIEEYDPISKVKDLNKHKDVGKIVVVVHHKNIGNASTLYVDPNGWKDIDVVNEKTMKGKAVSHSVGLAPPVGVAGSFVHYKTSFVDPERVPVAVFNFLYRSADKLESIFPATPEPSPEPEQAPEFMPAKNLNLTQIEDIQRRVQELESQRSGAIRGIKRERTEDDAEDGPVRRGRRERTTTYLEPRDDNDESFKEVDAPVRASQPSTQLD